MLRRCREDAVLVAPCDMIFLSEASIEKLKSAYEETGKPVLFEGEFLPLPGVYTKSMLPRMERHLESGDYRLKSLWEKEDYVTVKGPGKEELRNINRIEEYRKLAWIPAKEAAELLKNAAEEISETEMVSLKEATGRILSEDLAARRISRRFPVLLLTGMRSVPVTAGARPGSGRCALASRKRSTPDKWRSTAWEKERR